MGCIEQMNGKKLENIFQPVEKLSYLSPKILLQNKLRNSFIHSYICTKRVENATQHDKSDK